MAEAKLTIKVGADVKKAAEELKSLGYNIEAVKTKTEKANDSANFWTKTISKGASDSINQLVNLGAKFLTVTTVVTAAYKGIKSCVSEALKENQEASKQIEKINSAWTEIKKNLGNALLNAVKPALEDILYLLQKIQEWSEWWSAGSSYNTMLVEAEKAYQKGSHYDTSGMTYNELVYATNHLPDSHAYKLDADWAVQLANDLVEALANYKAPATSSTSASSSKSYGATRLTSSTSIENAEIAESWMSDFGDGWGETIHGMDNAVAAFTELKNGYDELAKSVTGEDEIAHWTDLSNTMQGYIDKVKEAREAQIDLLNNVSTVASSIMDIWGGIVDLETTWNNKEIERIENSTTSEEEKAVRIDEIKRKQFEAEKRNALAEAAVSLAQAMLKVYETYATPAMRYTMYALTATAGAIEIANIAQQQYTSSLATGGIVSQPTHALIGEGAEKEAVMPLSKLEQFVERPESSGTIVLNITVNGSGNGTAEDVYRAIERAQRTGVLPAWRYVS